jgi:phosphotriesterase-related protein
MRARVRTALGDVAAESLGATDYHEHLFQVTPLLPGDELDDEGASGEEAALLHRSGIRSMVDATPTALGRRPDAVARISARTGLHVVLTTGAHREEHYGPDHWLQKCSEEQLAARFEADLSEGLARADGPSAPRDATTPSGEPVRAGLLKAGIGYWSISPFERRVLAAVAAAHERTGAPVMVHLEHGSAMLEVLELLHGLGVALDRIVLAHVDRNPDPELHAEVARAGAYLGYDGMARTREWPDSTIVECIAAVAALGGGERILLGGDVARRSRYVAYGGMPGLSYLSERFVPRIRRATSDELVDAVLRRNPARLLVWESPRSRQALDIL